MNRSRNLRIWFWLIFVVFAITVTAILFVVRQSAEESPMISEVKAVSIATSKAVEIGFDVENLKPTVRMVKSNWDIQFHRTDKSLGGAPHFLISGETGEILEISATQ